MAVDTGQTGNERVVINGVSRSQGKRLLQGVPKLLWGGLGTYTDDLMVSSTLRLCLDYIGENYSKTFLAGASGAAFQT